MPNKPNIADIQWQGTEQPNPNDIQWEGTKNLSTQKQIDKPGLPLSLITNAPIYGKTILDGISQIIDVVKGLDAATLEQIRQQEELEQQHFMLQTG